MRSHNCVKLSAVVGLLALTTAAYGSQISFGPATVPGTAAIFDPDSVLSASMLASLGSNGSLGATPAVEALSFTAGTGQFFTFTASGMIGCCGSANIGPDAYVVPSNINSLGSISGFVAPAQLPLVGVFTNGSPSGSAPAPYNYSGGLAQSTFSPVLNQVFFIGDGLTGTGSGSVQQFNVPSTATQLWLGFADAFGFSGNPGFYGDNPGSLSVSGTLNTGGAAAIPEPGCGLLVCMGLIAVSLIRRR